MTPNSFAAPWLAFLSLISHDLFPQGVVGGQSGLNQHQAAIKWSSNVSSESLG